MKCGKEKSADAFPPVRGKAGIPRFDAAVPENAGEQREGSLANATRNHNMCSDVDALGFVLAEGQEQ